MQDNKPFQWTDDLVKRLIEERIIAPCDSLHSQLNDRISSFKEEYSKPNPLFTTEDGKEIFKGDRIWCVRKDFEIHNNPANEYDGTTDRYKYFSSEEAAKKYVNINKPVFSQREVQEFVMMVGKEPIPCIADKLHKLASSKIEEGE